MDEVLYDEAEEAARHEAALREAVERGRRFKIAGEVLKEFLDDRREEIISGFENGNYPEDISEPLSELRVMNRFRQLSQTQIDIGELAEKELMNYGSE